jgi:hypothetical protein
MTVYCETRGMTRPDASAPVRQEFALLLAFRLPGVDTGCRSWSTFRVRKPASIRLGLLLAVSALLSCQGEKPRERRCVDADGRYVDDGLCTGTTAGTGPEGTAVAGATGGWDAPDGGAPAQRGGYHFIWIPYGMFGGFGTYAPGYVRTGPPGTAAGATAAPGSVTRGGFGSTGAAHASPSSSSHGSSSVGS